MVLLTDYGTSKLPSAFPFFLSITAYACMFAVILTPLALTVVSIMLDLS